jgi:CRP/FNR family cyclic AMP-dependent transcriptional regulator
MNTDLRSREDAQAVDAESLPDYPLFRSLSVQHRQTLAQCSQRASFDTGDKVVETGDLTEGFFVVTGGSISLESPDTYPAEHVRTLGPGDILGWSWLFPPDYWQFNAVAKEATEAIFFSTSRLCQACDKDRNFGFQLFKLMSPATAAMSSFLHAA